MPEPPADIETPAAARARRTPALLWTIVALWTLGVLLVALVVGAWLISGTARVTGESYVVLEQPASESFETVSIFAIGRQTEWPGSELRQTPREWLDLEVQVTLEERWGERLDRRSLAPPGVRLTGPDADPNYPVDEETLPVLLMQTLGVYPQEGFEAEIEQIVTLLGWMGSADALDPADERTSREAFAERFEEPLAAQFGEVQYRPPQLHDDGPPAWLAWSVVVIGVLAWAGGLAGIRRWWVGPRPAGPIWV